MTKLFALVVIAACGNVNKISIDAALPSVLSLAPDHGIVTTVVTITGSNLGDAQGTVTVGAKPATVQSWSASSITIAVPDVFPGPADVVVTSATGAGAPQSFRVILPPRIYINNGADDQTLGLDTVSVLTFDPMTGATAAMGTPVSLGLAAPGFGGCDGSIAIIDSTRRLIASATNGLAVFDIDPVSGALTPVQGSPFTTSKVKGEGLSVNAAGTRVWLGHYDTAISVWNVASDGKLSEVVGSPFTAPAVDGAVASQDGHYVYGNSEDSTFAGFAVAADGTLTPLPNSPFPNAGYTFSFARRTGTDQLYFPTSSGLAVFQPGADGVPVKITSSPFMTGNEGNTPNGASFTSDGSRIYISAYGAQSIVGMSLAADGTPTQLSGSPWTFPTQLGGASCTQVSHDGTTLVQTAGSNSQLAVYSLGSNGTPTPVTSSPFTYTADASPAGIALTF